MTGVILGYFISNLENSLTNCEKYCTGNEEEE
jgi:hypothetical protein